MQEFHFECIRNMLRYLLLIIIIPLTALPGFGLWYYVGIGVIWGPWAAFVITMILACVALAVIWSLTKVKGCGILHENHAEIKLGKTVYNVDYSHIREIDNILNARSQRIWGVTTIEDEAIYITEELRNSENSKIMEQFMKALQEKVDMTKR